MRARLRALVARRQPGPRPHRVEVGELCIDTDSREACYARKLLELTRMEFALIAQRAGEPERVFSKQELQRDVWGNTR